MDAFSTDAAFANYSNSPPALVLATSEAALIRAQRTIEAAGLRSARMMLESSRERLRQQVASAALWIEIDFNATGQIDGWLADIVDEALGRNIGTVISTPFDLLDEISAMAEFDSVDIVVDGKEPERVAALGVAAAKSRIPVCVSDVSHDRSAERLRQLGDEVSRIASTLARLSAASMPARSATPSAAANAEPAPLSVETVREVIRARRLRARFFDEDLFADPAWDMMLDLLQAELGQHRVSVSSLCIAAAVPATTALRWLKKLVNDGLFIRRSDPHDGRRVFVELAPQTSSALRRYFGEVNDMAAI
jgi:hypothetical protein